MSETPREGVAAFGPEEEPVAKVSAEELQAHRDKQDASYCSAVAVRRYEDCPPWEKALRTIVLSGEMNIPASALVLVARKALADCGVPYEEKPV